MSEKKTEKEDSTSKPCPSVDTVHEVAETIFNEIIAPICSVPGVSANFYTAKFADYDNADPKNRKEILDKILAKHRIPGNILGTLQEYPLALIALYIVDKERES